MWHPAVVSALLPVGLIYHASMGRKVKSRLMVASEPVETAEKMCLPVCPAGLSVGQ